MSEITKLYENAELLYCNKCRHDSEIDCIYMCEGKHPPFTAEKQIELIKWLKDNRKFHTCGNWCTSVDSTGETIEHRDSKFEEALAGLINQLFAAQDLTEEEKEVLRGILRA